MPTTTDTALPRELYTAADVRAMDRHAIERLGIPGAELMERAGATAFATLRRRWPHARFVSVVCGGGNNGGDGYVIARLAMQQGLDVRVYAVTHPNALQGDARRAFELYDRQGGSWLDFVPAQLESAEVVVDALFGTGLTREITGLQAAVVAAINRSEAGILAVDIPSGLHADSGAVMGCAVNADVTVSFIGLKRGLFTGEGPACAGDVVYDDLQTPSEVRNGRACSAQLLFGEDTRLPPRRRNAHKGNFGHVLVIGGDRGLSGAARLAAEAAARSGAGLVSIATHPDHAAFLNVTRPELMCRGVSNRQDLQPLLDRASVIVLGPGLGQSEWSHLLYSAALGSGVPLVVDADGLNLLAGHPEHRTDWILTPHPGEAGRLLQTTTRDIEVDRFRWVAELQRRYGGVAVLKGAGTLIRNNDGPIQVCRAGNPGMASGGMGDVLTGIVAGLLAQGLTPVDAARFGVQWHASAGDLTARRNGERGLLASDLLAALRKVANA